jgi:hypothetical protein
MKKLVIVFLLIYSVSFAEEYINFSYFIQKQSLILSLGLENNGKYVDQELMFNFDLMDERWEIGFKDGINLVNFWDKLETLSIGSVGFSYLPRENEIENFDFPVRVGAYIQKSDDYSFISFEVPVWRNKGFDEIAKLSWRVRLGFKF